MQRQVVRFIYEHRAIPKRLLALLVPKPVLVRLKDFQIYVRLDDWAVGARIAVKRRYEQNVAKVFCSCLRPDSVVVDVGANIGYYSLLSAANIGDQGKVIAFEPDGDNCALLEMSVKRNSFKNVTIHCAAVADRNGTAALVMDDSNGRIELVSDFADAPQVELVTLDQALGNESRIDLIKLDVEGAEALALGGMKEILRRHRPVIISEFSPIALPLTSGVAPEEYLDELCTQGYDLYVIRGNGTAGQAPRSNQEIMQEYAESGSDHLDLKAVPNPHVHP
jgi:FkbM family methyltransferase